MATICVQTRLNPARHILESPCQYIHCHCLNFFGGLLSRRLWFVVCYGKLSLSDVPIRNNQAASDRASAVAKVPSKWRGRRKRTEFQPCWRVKCGMLLHPAGNIQFKVPHCPTDLQKSVEDFHICSCCDGCLEEDGTNYAPLGHPTPNTNLLWMRVFFVYHVGILTCPNTEGLRINVSRQVKPPKKFRQWQRTYWQGLSKIWRAGFNPVWMQMVATSSTCYDVVTFVTQWGKSASNFIAISSLVVKILKKCRVQWWVGHSVYILRYPLQSHIFFICILILNMCLKPCIIYKI